MRKLWLLAISLFFALGLTAGLSAPAQAHPRSHDLGTVSIIDACWHQTAGSQVVLLGHTAYDWRCRFWDSRGEVYTSVDLDQQCAIQYDRDAHAVYLDWNDPFSWRCFSR